MSTHARGFSVTSLSVSFLNTNIKSLGRFIANFTSALHGNPGGPERLNV